MDWFKDGEEVLVPQGNAIGFVYVIEFNNGDKYLGKKNLYSKRKRNFGKKEAALVTDKRKKLYEMVVKESNWITYESSNGDVKQRIKNGECHTKTILDWSYTPKQLTYLEIKYMFNLDVLNPKGNWLNDNVLGKFFKKELEKWEQIKR
jgi:hypothetical protein|tara:strand:+ start:265 stop:708 length:444 start_codon:yes stop_codon:yes gene_type:complete